MAFETWLLYLFAAAALCIAPGPNSLLVLSHGVTHGLRRTFATCLGGALGFTMIIAICMAGLGALLTASATAFTVLKWIGAAYLVYLGVVVWRATPFQIAKRPRSSRSDAAKLFAQGFLAAVSNPKGIVFFAALLPQFIDPARPQFLQFAILAGTFVSIEFLFELFLAGSATRLAPWLGRNSVGRWFNRVTGVTFVGIAGLLAATQR